jgi:hypothetical protein
LWSNPVLVAVSVHTNRTPTAPPPDGRMNFTFWPHSAGAHFATSVDFMLPPNRDTHNGTKFYLSRYNENAFSATRIAILGGRPALRPGGLTLSHFPPKIERKECLCFHEPLYSR